jgi:hypothetical protein
MDQDTGQGMPQDSASRNRHRRRPLLILAAIGLSIASIGSGVFSLAVFTSTATNGANTFSTGTVVLTTSPSTAFITVSGMLPGDSTTQGLTVTNGGTAALRYAMTTATTNTDTKGLAAQLVATVKTKDTDTAACTPFNGTSLYTGALSAALFGSPTQGAQAGDRTLASAASEVLCFQVSLPLATNDTFQNAATTATFTFAAEQTSNNP